MSHLGISAFGVIALFIALHAAAVTRLERVDPAEFARLGKPQPFHSDFSASSWMFTGYMLRCGFLRQGDVVLAVIGSFWYASALLGIGISVWLWTS
jgi:hypothetical protein